MNHRSYIKYRLTGSLSQTVVVNLCYFKTHRLAHAQIVTVVVNHRRTPLTSSGEKKRKNERKRLSGQRLEILSQLDDNYLPWLPTWSCGRYLWVLYLSMGRHESTAVWPLYSRAFCDYRPFDSQCPRRSLNATLALQQEDVNLA